MKKVICHEFQRDGRRVKSTGDEAAPPAATHERSRRDGADETSAFFARPVMIRSDRRPPRPPLSNGSGQDPTPPYFKDFTFPSKSTLMILVLNILTICSSQSIPACSREQHVREGRRCEGLRRCTRMKTQPQSFLSTRLPLQHFPNL